MKYVDSLIASPHFGERWAQHWMDLVRYADSCGHEYDYEFEGAWRYRDYLVRAFNADLPFDQFTKEHIAGDLLSPRIKDGRNEALLGTGWWQLQEQASAPVDLPNDEAERLDNQLDVLGKTFNALTIGCAVATTTSSIRSAPRSITDCSASQQPRRPFAPGRTVRPWMKSPRS